MRWTRDADATRLKGGGKKNLQQLIGLVSSFWVSEDELYSEVAHEAELQVQSSLEIMSEKPL